MQWIPGNRGGVRVEFSGQAASDGTFQVKERSPPTLAALPSNPCSSLFCHFRCTLSPQPCWPHPLVDTRSPSLPICPVCLLPGVCQGPPEGLPYGEEPKGRDTVGNRRGGSS